MGRKLKVTAAVILCLLMVLSPLLVRAFTNDQPASIVIGQSSFTSNESSPANASRIPATDIAFDQSGSLWVTSGTDCKIYEFVKGSGFTTGMSASIVLGEVSFSGACASEAATTFYTPFDVAFDSQGNLWVSDRGNSRVLEFVKPESGFTSDMAASLVIGQSSFTHDVGATNQTRFNAPFDIAFDPSGNLWVADSGNDRVLEYLESG